VSIVVQSDGRSRLAILDDAFVELSDGFGLSDEMLGSHILARRLFQTLKKLGAIVGLQVLDSGVFEVLDGRDLRLDPLGILGLLLVDVEDFAVVDASFDVGNGTGFLAFLKGQNGHLFNRTDENFGK